VTDDLLTLDRAAARLAVDRRTLQREIAAGAVPVIEIRGGTRIAPADLEAYIARRRRYRTVEPCRSENVVALPGRSVSGTADSALKKLLEARGRKRSSSRRSSAGGSSTSASAAPRGER
jgi:excisionase family DNA binding protein